MDDREMKSVLVAAELEDNPAHALWQLTALDLMVNQADAKEMSDDAVNAFYVLIGEALGYVGGAREAFNTLRYNRMV